MRNQPEPACLVIADITGYTSYLAGVELDHAQDILADLVDSVVAALRPTFRLAKLEGDAAFAYAITDTLDASTLMDTVERTYFAFRRRLRDIAQASQCDCNACSRMPSLDLKILAHHGVIGRQRVAGREELVGSPVIVAHRLLKNTITESTGIAAYALYTEPCLAVAGVTDPASLGLREHRETYDVVGELRGWVADLDAAWRADVERTRVIVEPANTLVTYEFDLPSPPSISWDYITSPARRPQWQAGVETVLEETRAGRRGVGTTNHCVHGRDAIVEEIQDWRPGEYLTMRWQVPMPNTPRITCTESLEATPSGTHVTYRIERPRSAKNRTALEGMLPMLEPLFRTGAANLQAVLAAEMARLADELADRPEPETAGVGRAIPRPACRIGGGPNVVMETAAAGGHALGRHAMQYALLIYTPEREGEVAPEELAAEMDGYNAFTEHVRSNGAMKGGEALDSVATATTVRVVDGKTITTDGPFAETKETLGGFYLIEAADLDEAIAYAAMLPGAKRGCIEVRPVWDYQIAGLETAASAAAGN